MTPGSLRDETDRLGSVDAGLAIRDENLPPRGVRKAHDHVDAALIDDETEKLATLEGDLVIVRLAGLHRAFHRLARFERPRIRLRRGRSRRGELDGQNGRRDCGRENRRHGSQPPVYRRSCYRLQPVRTKRRSARAGGVAAITIPALLVAARVAAQDLTIVSKTRFGEKQGTQTVFLTQKRMKTAGAGNDSIVDFSNGQMTFLDQEKKTYYVTSVTEMAAYAKHREDLSKASGFNAESFGPLQEATARKTGRARRIAGHPCDEWTVAMGEGLVFEVCAAPTLKVPRGYFDARAAAYAGMGPMGRHFARMFETLRTLRGYPLSFAMHVKMEGMRQESLVEATGVRRGPIPPAAFEVPADYAKKASPFTNLP